MTVIQTVFLLFLSVFVEKCFAQHSPRISNITQTQIKDIGDMVELSCSVQYSEDYPVIWIKIDKRPNGYGNIIPISIGNLVICPNPRYSIRYDPDNSTTTYTLQIKDIKETDAGLYSCQILFSPIRKVTRDVELQLRRSPSILNNSTKSVSVSDGQSVHLECYADGFPPPKISWRRENNAILPNGDSIYRGNILKIEQIRKEDRGTYYCVAENGVGRGTRLDITVHVEFAPVVTVLRLRVGQALQYNVKMECHVEAYPPPAITWLKNGVPLSYDNPSYRIANFATADESTDTTLRIISIDKTHFGPYICNATNKLGTAEGVVELFESVNPVCLPVCNKPN